MRTLSDSPPQSRSEAASNNSQRFIQWSQSPAFRSYLAGGGILKFAAAIFTLPLCGFSVGIEHVEELVSTAAMGGELTGVLDSSIISSDLERWQSFTRCETRLRNKFIFPYLLFLRQNPTSDTMCAYRRRNKEWRSSIYSRINLISIPETPGLR